MAFKIYVACLSAYNNGKLHGAWLDLDDYRDEDELMGDITDKVLNKSPEADAEKWAIHDYDYYDCPSLSFGETEDLDTLIAANEMINEHGEAYALYVDHVGASWDDVECFQDVYQGCYKNEEEFGEHLFDEIYLHDIPSHIQSYIDYERFTRDLFMGDYYSVEGSEGTHVFSSR